MGAAALKSTYVVVVVVVVVVVCYHAIAMLCNNMYNNSLASL